MQRSEVRPEGSTVLGAERTGQERPIDETSERKIGAGIRKTPEILVRRVEKLNSGIVRSPIGTEAVREFLNLCRTASKCITAMVMRLHTLSHL